MARDSAATVFLVEDDASVRKAVKRLLRSVGMKVLTFASAQEFLEYEMPATRGCLVLDLRMPGMSGLALQEQAAARHNELAVVVVTGHGDEELRRRAMEQGAVAVLLKPFDDQELLEAIDRALGR